jgi:hypothetical protein
MMRSAVLCLIVVLSISTGACSRVRPAAAPPSWLPLAADSRLYTDNAGGVADSMRTVVRDAGTLRLLWQQATTGQSAPPPVPSIDFGRDMVLVVAAGRMTPDDEIRVDSVRVRREADASGRSQEVMSILVRVIEGCGRFSAPAFPIDVVRVRRFDGPVNFVERRERAAC